MRPPAQLVPTMQEADGTRGKKGKSKRYRGRSASDSDSYSDSSDSESSADSQSSDSESGSDSDSMMAPPRMALSKKSGKKMTERPGRVRMSAASALNVGVVMDDDDDDAADMEYAESWGRPHKGSGYSGPAGLEGSTGTITMTGFYDLKAGGIDKDGCVKLDLLVQERDRIAAAANRMNIEHGYVVKVQTVAVSNTTNVPVVVEMLGVQNNDQDPTNARFIISTGPPQGKDVVYAADLTDTQRAALLYMGTDDAERILNEETGPVSAMSQPRLLRVPSASSYRKCLGIKSHSIMNVNFRECEERMKQGEWSQEMVNWRTGLLLMIAADATMRGGRPIIRDADFRAAVKRGEGEIRTEEPIWADVRERVIRYFKMQARHVNVSKMRVRICPLGNSASVVSDAAYLQKWNATPAEVRDKKLTISIVLRVSVVFPHANGTAVDSSRTP